MFDRTAPLPLSFFGDVNDVSPVVDAPTLSTHAVEGHGDPHGHGDSPLRNSQRVVASIASEALDNNTALRIRVLEQLVVTCANLLDVATAHVEKL